MFQYQEIQKVNNVTIIKASNGRFGLKDSSNGIVLAPKYDLIEPLNINGGNRYLQIKENGLIGIYDSVKVDFECYCKLSQIYVSQKKIKGKEPIFKCSFLSRIPFFMLERRN